MLYEMAESVINSIVGGPDYEHADVKEKIILQRFFEGLFLDVELMCVKLRCVELKVC